MLSIVEIKEKLNVMKQDIINSNGFKINLSYFLIEKKFELVNNTEFLEKLSGYIYAYNKNRQIAEFRINCLKIFTPVITEYEKQVLKKKPLYSKIFMKKFSTLHKLNIDR